MRIIISLLFAVAAEASIPQGYLDRLVAAIWVAEGGSRARAHYGILSVQVRDQREARQVAVRTVRRHWDDWTRRGRPGCFVADLGRRWCPPSVDPVGYRHWVRNVRHYLDR